MSRRPDAFARRVFEDRVFRSGLPLILHCPKALFPFVSDCNSLRPPRIQFVFVEQRHRDKPVSVCFYIEFVDDCEPLLPGFAGLLFDLLITDLHKGGLGFGHEVDPIFVTVNVGTFN